METLLLSSGSPARERGRDPSQTVAGPAAGEVQVVRSRRVGLCVACLAPLYVESCGSDQHQHTLGPLLGPAACRTPSGSPQTAWGGWRKVQVSRCLLIQARMGGTESTRRPGPREGEAGRAMPDPFPARFRSQPRHGQVTRVMHCDAPVGPFPESLRQKSAQRRADPKSHSPSGGLGG